MAPVIGSLNMQKLDFLWNALSSFSKATGLPVSVINEQEEKVNIPPLSLTFGEEPRFCQTLRSSPYGSRKCWRFYQQVVFSLARFGAPYIFRCHAGLVSCAVPVFLEECQKATIICGRVLMWERDEVFEWELREANRMLNINLADLFEESHQLKIVSPEEARAIADMLLIIARYVSGIDILNSLAIRGSEMLAHFEQASTCFREKKQKLASKVKTRKNEKLDHTREVLEAIEFMRHHYREKLTLESISRAVYLSPYHLSRVFKQELGCTIMGFLTQLRLREAKKMMCTTNYSIAAIASFVGFEDPSHFTKVFKKWEKISPAQYRTMIGQKYKVGHF